jgi:PAS domain S-box-containing protein
MGDDSSDSERARTDTEQYERLRALFENAQSAIVEYVYIDSEPVVQDVNRRFEEIFGFDTEAVVGNSLDEFVVPPEKTDEATQLNEQVARGEPLRTEVKRLTDDGHRSFVVRNAPIHTKDEVRGYAIYTDITERKERERELEATKQRLEQSNEKLEQFASVVSHDLRNPLNAAQLRFDLVRDDVSGEDAEAVEENLDRMETMIEDLLTLARSGQTVEDPEPVPLADAARTAWSHADLEDCELTSSIPEGVTVQADHDRLLHVFENLFRNAADHNDPPVTIRVGTLDIPGTDETDGDLPGFFVEDDGAGIPESERAEVFEHGYTTNTDGTGFGLSIVSEIVEAHGWTVSVDESVSGGARFEVDTTGQS